MPKGLPGALDTLLREHAATYAPHYPPSDNSDHGPMAYLAMHGLGIGFADIAMFADAYRSRLVPTMPPKAAVSDATWRDHIGRRESYAALLAFFEREIGALGWQATVSRYLPQLISGWVRDAFHPLIRLSYGIDFESAPEIAAGLAYMTITGDDPVLALIAKRAASGSQGRAHLASLQSLRSSAFSRGPFNVRYQRITAGAAELVPAGGSSESILEDVSRTCLEVFHATHDFFALHLVTSSHAFRVCAPWAGPNLAPLFSVGIATAYLAIGAPQFDPLARAAAAVPIERLRKATDEHDIKIAYSCVAQSRAFADPTYEWVATEYLEPRLPATR